MRQIRFRSIRWLTAMLMVGSFAAISYAQEANADDLQAISRMAKQGQRSAALAKLDAYLANNPKDLSARFMKGVLLVEQAEQSRPKNSKEARDPNRYREAINVFYGIIKDNPDHPEPYNNLAAIYASLDQWDKAKEMLEAAIRTNPSYATAHENLGDVYAKLASRAYEKALQLDTNSPVVQNKLRLISDLFPQEGTHHYQQPIVASSARPTAHEHHKDKEPKFAPVNIASSTHTSNARSTSGTFKPTVASAEITQAKPPVMAMSSNHGKRETSTNKGVNSAPAAVTLPMEKNNERSNQGNDTQQDAVLDVVHNWATSWSKQNVSEYLSYYSGEFKPSNHSKSVWRKRRESLVSRPKSIQIDIENAKVQMKGNQAVVTFKQDYQSNLIGHDSMTKRLVLSKENGQWRIVRESGR